MDMKMMKNYGIALIQMSVTDDKAANNATAVRMIRECCRLNMPRCVMLPEYFNTPFGKRPLFERFAEIIPTGETCLMMSKLAAELKIYLICGSMPERDAFDAKKMYNTMVVFGPTGEMLAKYRQMHLMRMMRPAKMDGDAMLKSMKLMDGKKDAMTMDDYDALMRHDGGDYIMAGDQMGFFEMDGMKVGMCIGSDLMYGYMATWYREMGCDMLMYAVSFPERMGAMYMEKLLAVRAMETQCYVMGASMARMERMEYATCGRSMFMDPFGRMMGMAGMGSEMLMQKFDFVGLKEMRMMMPVFECRRKDLFQMSYKF